MRLCTKSGGAQKSWCLSLDNSFFCFNLKKGSQKFHPSCFSKFIFAARARCALRALGLLLADSALTVGRGKTFWPVDRVFCENGHKLPIWEMKRLSEGYKRAVDQNWGHMAKNGIFGQKPRFWAQKKHTLLNSNHVLATTGKSCSKKKVAFSQIYITLLRYFCCFLR